MKKYFFAALLVLCLPLAVLAQDAFNLAGKWNATVRGTTITMVFEEGGHAQMGEGGDVRGGIQANGTRDVDITYKADYTKKPAELDLVIANVATGEKFELYGIVDIISRNEIRIFMGAGERPAEFSSTDTAVFKRE
jgi:hypothetical protein